ncbi:DNA primase [Mulberry dwarf phytoplasma]|uniref:DNA primase n=1 Tax=Mulberry dwarf phytoplasma TaxID=186171 RepID=UPI001D112689|nr:DNA primase [Mulberry dwarf phytoplasma]
MEDNKQLIDQINEKMPILDLVQEFVQLKKSGKNYMGLCPFHDEKTPSFSVSPERNIGVCMSCKKGGNPVFFYKSIKNTSLNQAIFELATRLGIATSLPQQSTHQYQKFYNIMQEAADFYSHQLKHNKQVLNYLEKRGFDNDIIKHFKLGYAPKASHLSRYLMEGTKFDPDDIKKLSLINQDDKTGNFYDFFKNRLIFPITNKSGQIVAFSSRSLDDQMPKYLNSPETIIFKKGETLYQYYENQAEIRKKQKVILHEGFFDVMASFKAQFKNVVATMGTNLTLDHAKLLKKLTDKIIIAYDGDKAGKTATLEMGTFLQKNHFKVQIVDFPNNLDPDEYIKTEGPEKYQHLLTDNLKDFLALKVDLICQQMDSYNQAQTKKELQELFQSSSFEIKMLYQEYLQKTYQLTVNLNSQVSINKTPKPPYIAHTKQQLNVTKFDIKIEIIIELLLNAAFFKTQNPKTFATIKKTPGFDDLQCSCLLNYIKNYYKKNPKQTCIPWEEIKNTAFKENIDDLLTSIEKHHFFKMEKRPLLQDKEGKIFNNYIKELEIRDKIEQKQQKINELNDKLLPIDNTEKNKLQKKKDKLKKERRQLQQQLSELVNDIFC